MWYSVVIGDELAKQRGLPRKTIRERAAPPTFDIAIELLDRSASVNAICIRLKLQIAKIHIQSKQNVRLSLHSSIVFESFVLQL